MKDSHRVKHSISRQLMLRCVLITACTVLFTFAINFIFLEKIYERNKRDRLRDVYDVIVQYEDGQMSYSSFEEKVGILCGTYNISYIITDSDSNTVSTSISSPNELNSLLREMVLEGNSDVYEVIEEGRNYSVCIVLNKQNHMEYLTMWGYLNNGDFFMIGTALEGVRAAVALSNRFFILVGSIGFIIASIVVFFISKKITRPILELADITDKMQQLDFTAKYSTRANNEIDILGNNFNKMSDKLEDTIGQLKNANALLQEDVEKKTNIDNMRKEFIANVSHELKTPIALISGYAEGLKEAVNDDPESREFYCDVIIDEAGKMNRMVKQLLKLNSLEFGGDEPEFTKICLSDLIRNCIMAEEIIVKSMGISVETDIEDGVYVMADEYLLDEAFANFFSNALNHCDGARKICVRVYSDKNMVNVSVFNTGKNIPEESIKHIWDKFYKVDKARTREYGGSGIGLSIVKAAMDSCKGSCSVINRENGVEFVFSVTKMNM